MLERPTWQGTEEGLQPIARKELNPANIHKSKLEKVIFPVMSTPQVTP